jgi:hypothetical protein
VENTGTGFYAGYFDGDLVYTGSLIGPSDNKLKKNVREAGNTLSLLLQLEPKRFEYKTDEYPGINLPKGEQLGFIAQDVEKMLPQLVKEVISPSQSDENGNTIHPQTRYKAVDYTGFIPMLVTAIKEQQHVIDSLNTVINDRLTVLENGLSQCCGFNARMAAPAEGNETNNITVELNALQVIVLEQNVPNPFAEQTSISYFIPEDVKEAYLIFYDMNGRTIQKAAVPNGYGTVTVFASNLSTGAYSYTLVIDGKPAETKRMLKSK